VTEASGKGAVLTVPGFNYIARLVRYCNGVALVCLVLLICLEAFLRGVFDVSLGFAEEVTGYLMVALTLNGAASAIRAGALFQVSFVFDRLGGKSQIFLIRFGCVLSIFVVVVLAWKGLDLVSSSLERGKFAATTLRTPLWIPQLLLPVGFALVILSLVEQFLLAGRRVKDSILGSKSE
jgi:TRAP-type C4-dicarboxylate transport system permease small subunit